MTNIVSKPVTKEYEEGWERIFGKSIKAELFYWCDVCGILSYKPRCSDCEKRHGTTMSALLITAQFLEKHEGFLPAYMLNPDGSMKEGTWF